MPSLLLKRFRRKRNLQDDSSSSDDQGENYRTPTASERVLNTYELLENILGCLEPTHLRRVRTVSKSWNDLVFRSQALDNTRKVGLKPQEHRPVSVLIFGAAHTGKKSLMCQWLCPHLSFGYHSPLEDAFRKYVTIDEESWQSEIVCINPAVWNLNAERTLLELPTHAYCFIYSVTSRRSFDLVRELYTQTMSFLATHNQSDNEDNDDFDGGESAFIENKLRQKSVLTPVGLIANKCDLDSLVNGWDVSREEGAALAAEMGCPFYETSAETHSNYGVDEALMGVLREYKEKRLVDLQMIEKTRQRKNQRKLQRQNQSKRPTSSTTASTNTDKSITTTSTRTISSSSRSGTSFLNRALKELSRSKRLHDAAVRLSIMRKNVIVENTSKA